MSKVEEKASKEIFMLQAKAKGYVGLGFSPSGGMRGADIVLASVNHLGKPFISVSFE